MSEYTRRIDLHTHTTASDGTLTPGELVRMAARIGLAAVAITDHDSVGGIEEALAAGAECGVEVIPGVELSSEYERVEIHVLGLFIDYHDKGLIYALKKFKENRSGRNAKIIGKLKEHGFDISEEELNARNPDSVISRPHIARFLVDTGQARDVRTVFELYIREGGPCFADREKITPCRAVELIREAGGVSILAHPCLYKMDLENLERMTASLKEAGLDGIEAIYSKNKPGDENIWRAWADKYDLIYSGGSDFHGANKPDIALGTGRGDLFVPYSVLERMKEILCLKVYAKYT